MEKRCLCLFNAPSRFLLNKNFNLIGFFQIVAHQWIKFLYQALEEQKWIWYLLKGQSSFRSIQNLKFKYCVRFTYFQLDYEPKGFFHEHENLSFKKPIAKTFISFQKTILTKDLFGESSLTLDTIRSSAPELESERTQTSDKTIVKVWIKFISAGNVTLKENQSNQNETNLWSCHTIQLALWGFKWSQEIDQHPIIIIWSQLPNSMWGQLL